MGRKLVRAWVKGNQEFPSVYGVKREFACELIKMGDIIVPEKEKALKLKCPDQYLELLGWKWVKRIPRYDD